MEAMTAVRPDVADDYAYAVAAGLPEGDDDISRELRIDYLLERIGQERHEIARVNEFTQRRIQMIRDHGDEQAAMVQRRISYLEDMVRTHLPMTGDEFAAAYRKKSLNLPHGKVGYRHLPASVVIHDQTAAVEWAKAHGVPVTVKESLGKTGVIAHIKATGELPETDAIEYVDASERFFVTPAEPVQ